MTGFFYKTYKWTQKKTQDIRQGDPIQRREDGYGVIESMVLESLVYH